MEVEPEALAVVELESAVVSTTAAVVIDAVLPTLVVLSLLLVLVAWAADGWSMSSRPPRSATEAAPTIRITTMVVTAPDIPGDLCDRCAMQTILF
jgi:hypothetical protein